MWKVYDAVTGEPIYESEYLENCAVVIADKEKPERFHIVGGMGVPIWNVEGGLDALASEDVSMFLEEIVDGDFAMPADDIRNNPALVEDVISRYRGYMDVDLNSGCGENFEYAIDEAIQAMKG